MPEILPPRVLFLTARLGRVRVLLFSKGFFIEYEHQTDKVVDEYVSKMKFGVQIYVGVCVLWSLVWYSGAFEYVFGANAWENLSVVRGEWVERIFLAPAS